MYKMYTKCWKMKIYAHNLLTAQIFSPPNDGKSHRGTQSLVIITTLPAYRFYFEGHNIATFSLQISTDWPLDLFLENDKC